MANRRDTDQPTDDNSTATVSEKGPATVSEKGPARPTGRDHVVGRRARRRARDTRRRGPAAALRSEAHPRARPHGRGGGGPRSQPRARCGGEVARIGQARLRARQSANGNVTGYVGPNATIASATFTKPA